MQTLHSETRAAGTQATKVLLVINADTSRQPGPPANRATERLADYTALRQTLDADVLDWQAFNTGRIVRTASKVLGKGATLAMLAWARRKRYDALYCDSENNGLVLAGLLKATRSRIPLAMIGHWITPTKKALLLKRLRLYSHISRIFLHSSAQYDEAVHTLGIPEAKLRLLPYQVDTEFWQPTNAHTTSTPTDAPYICTAGLEFRDYPTLIEAVRGLDVTLKIGAASHWSKRTGDLTAAELPPNVEVSSYNYSELRDLYAGARFVVVPLRDVDFQAGITLILEAMAMGKAVIVSRSVGQGDTIVDRRTTTRSNTPRATTGNLGAFTGVDDYDATDATGFYVSVGDAAGLRRAIERLLSHPAEAAELGAHGRRIAESLFSVEAFAARVAHELQSLTL